MRFEFHYHLRRPEIYLYGLIFFLISFISFIGSAGYFDGAKTGIAEGQKSLINSAFQIHLFFLNLNQLFLFLAPALLGAAAYKDFRFRFHHLLFAYPLSKQPYFWGKFIPALSLILLISLAAVLGLMLGECMPGLDASLLGEIRYSAYLYSYFLFCLPNCLMSGMLVYGLVLWTRNRYAGFAGIIGIFLFRFVLQKINYQNAYFLALFDPLGEYTSQYLLQDWSREAQNTQPLPWARLLIYNRLIWLGLVSVFSIISYKAFALSQSSPEFFKIKKVRKNISPSLRPNIFILFPSHISLPPFHFWRSLWHLSWGQMGYILKGKGFLVFCCLGVLCVYLSLRQVTQRAEFSLLPLTHLILSIPSFFYGSFMLAFCFIYAGILGHRERQCRFYPFLDTSPLPDWVLMGGKLLALLKVQMLMLVILMVTGIGLQIQAGYFHFEMGLYLFHLFVPFFSYLLLWTVLALAVHTFIPHFYLGTLLLFLAWMGLGVLSDLG
ncbi:MAG: hypothetical protein AAFU64_12690, partial [Bacteroidota bacterium]